MDSLQEKFGGEPDIISKRPKWVPFIALCLGGAVVTSIFGYFWWPEPASTPIVEEQIELPLSANEVETYRASLPKTTATGVASSPAVIPATRKTSVTLAPEGTETPVAEPVSTFVPPAAATPVTVTTVGQAGEVGAPTQDTTTNTLYAEGDITVDGVVVTQPDAANLTPIEATVVVAAVDVATNQMVVTSGGELLTLKMVGGRLQTNDGKLVSLSSITKNDILAISGDQLADAPVIQVRTASLIGVQEFIDVVE